MRFLLLAAFYSSILAAQTTVISNVRGENVSHSDMLLKFDISGPTHSENGSNVLFDYVRVRWTKAPDSCLNNPNAQVRATTYAPFDQGTPNKQGPTFQLILPGITPGGGTVNVCPEISSDNQNWATAMGSVTLVPLPPAHPAQPKRTYIPAIPNPPNTSGWEVRTSTCGNHRQDFDYALTHSDTGVVLQIPHNEVCNDDPFGPAYSSPLQPDVRRLTPSQFTQDASGHTLVTYQNHGFAEGQGVNFAHNYAWMPGEQQHGCAGLNVGRTYYVTNPTANTFNLTCDAPKSKGGKVAGYSWPANGNGANIFMAPYPRQIKGFVIRTDTPDNQFAAKGSRAGIEWLPKMPTMTRSTANGNQSSNIFFTSLDGENISFLIGKVYVMGLHILGAPVYTLNSGFPIITSQDTQDITFDRCVIEGSRGYGTGYWRGIQWGGHNQTIQNSTFYHMTISDDTKYRSDWRPENGVQAIEAGAGPGPYTFYNNDVDTAGNFLHFSDDSKYQDRAGYRIERNHFSTPFKYAFGMPQSDGHLYGTRQLVEFKSGQQIMVKGNDFDQSFHGLSSTTLVFTSVDTTWPITDVEVAYNKFEHVFGATMMGNSTMGGRFQSPPANRYWYHDNIIWDTDGWNYHSHSASLGQYAGWAVQSMGDGEDQVFEHNALYDMKGTAPAVIYGSGSPAEGVQIRNNFLYVPDYAGMNGFLQEGPGPRGQAYLDWKFPTAKYDGNVLLSNLMNSAQLRAVFPSSLWTIPADPTTYARDVFADPDHGDFHPKVKLAGTDGRPVGPDMTKFDIAQGTTTFKNLSRVTSGAAQVNFTAPDGAACPVDWSTSDLVNSFTRVSDTAHGRDHFARLTNLPANSSVQIRINCVHPLTIQVQTR